MSGSCRRMACRPLAKVSQPHPLVDLDLVDPGHLVLDRVLQRDHIDVGPDHGGQAGVQRRGLARPGRPGDQHQPLRLGQRPLERLPVVVGQADLGDGLGLLALLAEQPDHHRLAVHGRHGRDPGVGLQPLQADAAAAVLRLAPLGDVHAGQDLDAGDQRPLDRLGDHDDLAQQPVDAEADVDVALLRLDVDVGGAAVQGLAHDGVDQPDHRRVVDVADLLEVLVLVLGGLQALDVLEGAEGVGDPAAGAGAAVVAVDRLLQVGGGRHRGADRAQLGRQADVVQRQHVGRVGQGDGEHVVGQGDRHRHVPHGDVAGQHRQGLVGDRQAAEVDERQPELVGEGAGDLHLVGEAQLGDDLPEPAPPARVLPLRPQGMLELVAREHAAVDQHLTEPAPGCNAAGGAAIRAPAQRCAAIATASPFRRPPACIGTPGHVLTPTARGRATSGPGG